MLTLTTSRGFKIKLVKEYYKGHRQCAEYRVWGKLKLHNGKTVKLADKVTVEEVKP